MKLSVLYSTSAIMMACAVADTEEFHKNWHDKSWHGHHPHDWKNKWHDHHPYHPDHHNGSDRPCYNGYDKVCIHPDCDSWGYSDDVNAACGKAWYCDDNVSVWNWDENDFDPSAVHCGCNNICYKTASVKENGGHGGWKQWECCDDEKDKQMDKQEKMLRGAEEEKLSPLKSE